MCSLLDKACQRFGTGIKNVYERNRASWSAVRVDAGKLVDFCRGFVLSTAERGRVTHFKSDKAYGRAAILQGDVGT